MQPPSLADRLAAETEQRATTPLAEPLRISHPSRVTVGSAIAEGIASLQRQAAHAGQATNTPREPRQLPPTPDAAELERTAAQHQHERDQAWQARIAEANAPGRRR